MFTKKLANYHVRNQRGGPSVREDLASDRCIGPRQAIIRPCGAQVATYQDKEKPNRHLVDNPIYSKIIFGSRATEPFQHVQGGSLVASVMTIFLDTVMKDAARHMEVHCLV